MLLKPLFIFWRETYEKRIFHEFFLSFFFGFLVIIGDLCIRSGFDAAILAIGTKIENKCISASFGSRTLLTHALYFMSQSFVPRISIISVLSRKSRHK